MGPGAVWTPIGMRRVFWYVPPRLRHWSQSPERDQLKRAIWKMNHGGCRGWKWGWEQGAEDREKLASLERGSGRGDQDTGQGGARSGGGKGVWTGLK